MPVYNHPVTVRLAPTNYAPFQGSVLWNAFTNPSSDVIPHGTTDGVFPDALIKTIPNNLYNIKNLCDATGDADVLPSQEIEINASHSNPKKPFDSFRGGAYIDEPRALLTQTVNANQNAKNTFNLTGHVGCFVDYARSKGATAFNLFMHGQCDRDGDPDPLYESSTIPAPQGETDIADQFDNQDPTVSSYVTFKSSEATPGSSITAKLISFRKSLHHGFAKITRDNMAGMSMANGVGGKVYLTSFGDSFNWGNVQGLSAGGKCTINTYSTVSGRSVSETAQANGIRFQLPSTVSCSAWGGTFEGIFGNNARFSNSSESSLFGNGNYQHNGAISSADTDYDVEGELTVYQLSELSATSSLSIRPEYAPTYGNKNYLAIGQRVSSTPRLSTLGIVPGSYIRISGSASNNGIYQVVSVLPGIPGDDNENVRIGGGPAFEYIELSRNITVEPTGANITVQNVSDLPILHIKYRQPVTT